MKSWIRAKELLMYSRLERLRRSDLILKYIAGPSGEMHWSMLEPGQTKAGFRIEVEIIECRVQEMRLQI